MDEWGVDVALTGSHGQGKNSIAYLHLHLLKYTATDAFTYKACISKDCKEMNVAVRFPEVGFKQMFDVWIMELQLLSTLVKFSSSNTMF